MYLWIGCWEENKIHSGEWILFFILCVAITAITSFVILSERSLLGNGFLVADAPRNDNVGEALRLPKNGTGDPSPTNSTGERRANYVRSVTAVWQLCAKMPCTANAVQGWGYGYIFL